VVYVIIKSLTSSKTAKIGFEVKVKNRVPFFNPPLESDILIPVIIDADGNILGEISFTYQSPKAIDHD
jgi:hypothetical protein